MAVTAKFYGPAFKHLQNGDIDLDTNTIKVALLTSSYTPSQAHESATDLTLASNEVTGTGYTARGATLSSVTISYATLVTTFDAADTAWTSSTITARYAVVYKDTGTDSTSWLIGYIDFGADQTSSAGTFTIQWNASGIATVTVS